MSAVDSSVCIAATLAWHEMHERCAPKARDALIPAHALIESYAVLTRLPPPHRIAPSLAAELLRQRFGGTRTLTLSAALQRHIVDRLLEADVSGGASYDGLVALTAHAHNEVLLTCDERAIGTYERLGVAFEMIAAD